MVQPNWTEPVASPSGNRDEKGTQVNLSIAEAEQVLQTVHDTLLALIYDDVSGIPGIRETLAKEGLKLNIQIEASIDSTSLASNRGLAALGLSTSTPGVEDGLENWRDMGIRLDDLREAAQIEVRRNVEAENAVYNRIRTVAATLSPRGRNYSWGWLHLHFPEIGLGPNATTVQDERFALLSIGTYWEKIVETAIAAFRTRSDKAEVLTRFLATLNFANENT
jgi:hypothetical protein